MAPEWVNSEHAEDFLLTLAAPAPLAAPQHESVIHWATKLLSELRSGRVIVYEGVQHYPNKANRDSGIVQLVFRAKGKLAAKVQVQIGSLSRDMDVWVRPLDSAPLRLILCDMDSTIIPTETLNELAREAGVGEQVASITKRAMNGDLNFSQALRERVSLLKGLDLAVIDNCVTQITINPGADSLIRNLRASNVYTVLVSGGFAPFVEHVATRLGFDRWQANKLESYEGSLTGRVAAPLIDGLSKQTTLVEEMNRMGITRRQVAAIGDGANDIGMLCEAGYGIAYRAKPELLKYANCVLEHAHLDSLLSFFPLPRSEYHLTDAIC